MRSRPWTCSLQSGRESRCPCCKARRLGAGFSPQGGPRSPPQHQDSPVRPGPQQKAPGQCWLLACESTPPPRCGIDFVGEICYTNGRRASRWKRSRWPDRGTSPGVCFLPRGTQGGFSLCVCAWSKSSRSTGTREGLRGPRAVGQVHEDGFCRKGLSSGAPSRQPPCPATQNWGGHSSVTQSQPETPQRGRAGRAFTGVRDDPASHRSSQ